MGSEMCIRDRNHRHLVLDPVGRYLARDYVASDVLVIDGVPLSGEDPRVADATLPSAVVIDPTAPGGPVPEIAGDQVLVDPDLQVIGLDAVDVRDVQTTWVVAMTVAWLVFLAPFALALAAAVQTLIGRRPGSRTRSPRQVTGE